MTSPPPGQWGPPPAGPPVGPPYGPPSWGPQQPPGPPKRGNGLKWVLGGVVLLVVVAVTVGATLLFTRGDSVGDPPTATSATPTTSGATSDIASANDTGPVRIITDDPTCAAWTPIVNTLVSRENGWIERDPAIPATAWSATQRAEYDAVGVAMRDAADQTVALAKTTPHRVMRELYEQTVAFWRAYADKIPTYTAVDNHLASAAVSAASAVTSICNAIDYGSAAARSPLVAQAAPPSRVAPPGNPMAPRRFLTSADPICTDWAATVDQYNRDVGAWVNTDANIPVDQWSPEQRTLTAAATPVMRTLATSVDQLGRRSSNATLEDFAVLSAVYLRAYIQALATYSPADSDLYKTATRASVLVNEACLAAGI